MAAEFRVGDKVRVAVPWVKGCNPGDTGTVALVTRLGGHVVLYHVEMDPPSAAGLASFYPKEIEPATP